MGSRAGRADLHIHTTLSDGAATPAQVASVLAHGDLDVAAVTDHDTIEGALRVRELLHGWGPEIVIGAEISSADGHLLALFVERDVPAGRGAHETVQRIHEQGGLAIAAHPYFPICSLGDLASRVAFDGIEVANGTPLGELANRRALQRLGSIGLARLGGSDAHVLGAVGHVTTRFPGRDGADLRAAIERGETWPAFDWGRHLAIAPTHLLRMARLMLGDLAAARRPRVIEQE